MALFNGRREKSKRNMYDLRNGAKQFQTVMNFLRTTKEETVTMCEWSSFFISKVKYLISGKLAHCVWCLKIIRRS